MRDQSDPAPHPGLVLERDFLQPSGLSQTALAHHLDVSLTTINQIVSGRRGVSLLMGQLLSQALGTDPEYWLFLQLRHDLAANPAPRRVPQIWRDAPGPRPSPNGHPRAAPPARESGAERR